MGNIKNFFIILLVIIIGVNLMIFTFSDNDKSVQPVKVSNDIETEENVVDNKNELIKKQFEEYKQTVKWKESAKQSRILAGKEEKVYFDVKKFIEKFEGLESQTKSINIEFELEVLSDSTFYVSFIERETNTIFTVYRKNGSELKEGEKVILKGEVGSWLGNEIKIEKGVVIKE